MRVLRQLAAIPRAFQINMLIRPRRRRDAALRAQWKKAQDAIIAANTAEEEHKAELAQGAEAAIGDDPLAAVEGETHGTDADAGEYLNEEAKDGE